MTEQTGDARTVLRQAVETAALGELCFPTGVDVCQRVMKAVDNPDLGLEDLARIVLAEPLLSARLIGLANTVALNPYAQPVRDVKHALMRVGLGPVRTVAISLLLDQLRQGQRHASLRELANRLWERSVQVAAIAYVLAGKLSSLDADEAMSAGIVHDLGRFYLLSRAVDFPELMEDRGLLAAVLGDLARPAGARVLAALELPGSVQLAVAESDCYRGPVPPASLGDLLFVARTLSPHPDPLIPAGLATDGSDSLAALGLDPGTVRDIIAASGDEIYSIVLALES